MGAIGGIQRLTAGEARLLSAQATAANTKVLLDVVDESLRRAQELREQRQKEADERQEIEDRIRRREDAQELERKDAQRVAHEADIRRAQTLERDALERGNQNEVNLAREQEADARDRVALLDVQA